MDILGAASRLQQRARRLSLPETNDDAARRQLATALAWLAAFAAVVHAVSFVGSGPIDDDFITYRYARNWVEGQGLAFNAGQRFEGFTAPLWVMILALGWKASVAPALLSVSLSIISTGVATLAVGRAWGRRYRHQVWPLPALFLALTPAFAWHGVAGLGSTLLAALLALWFDLYDRAHRAGRASKGAAVYLALACLLRQECALFALFYVLLEWRRRPSPWLALPVLSLLGWTLFRLVYFGRLLPITYSVKKLPLLADLELGLEYLLLSTLFAGVGLLWIASLLPRVSRPFSKTLGFPTRHGPLDVAFLGCSAHALYVVYVGGDYVPFARFFIPTLPLLAFVGLAGVMDALPSTRARLAAVFVLLLPVQWGHLYRENRFLEHSFLTERWRRLGEHLGHVLPEGASVAMAPIGAFGWASDLWIVDILGLTHDGMLAAEPDPVIWVKGHQRTDPDWVLAQRPDFVILANGQRHGRELLINPWERKLFAHPRFQNEYVMTQIEIPGDAPLDLFQRADIAPLSGAALRVD